VHERGTSIGPRTRHGPLRPRSSGARRGRPPASRGRGHRRHHRGRTERVTLIEFVLDDAERENWRVHVIPTLAMCAGRAKVAEPHWCALRESVSFILTDRADGRAMAVLVREPSSDTPDHGPDPLADTTRGSGDP